MVLYLKGKDINTLITYQISINKSISYKQNGFKLSSNKKTNKQNVGVALHIVGRIS